MADALYLAEKAFYEAATIENLKPQNERCAMNGSHPGDNCRYHDAWDRYGVAIATALEVAMAEKERRNA